VSERGEGVREGIERGGGARRGGAAGRADLHSACIVHLLSPVTTS
jgi:hypothetical protein